MSHTELGTVVTGKVFSRRRVVCFILGGLMIAGLRLRAASPAFPVTDGEKINVRDPQSKSSVIPRGSPDSLRPGSTEPLEFLFKDAAKSRVHYWWNAISPEVTARTLSNGTRSNIRKSDYIGPEACKNCHAANYEKWLTHAHRLMNALATPEHVRGDFSGKQEMQYLGGKATFFQLDGTNHMRLERDGAAREFIVNRTLGSRFFHIIGTMIVGPEPADHPNRLVDHVLPLGYWLDKQEWVPIVHVDEEKPDGQREDAFAGPSNIPYDESCSTCHTTWPVGDWLMTFGGMNRVDFYSPFSMNFLASGYLKEAHPDVQKEIQTTGINNVDALQLAFRRINAKPVKDHAVVLGITCEACHNGAKAHAENSTPTAAALSPLFFPSSPNIYEGASTRSEAWGRKPQNLNFVCSRCHSGGRPRFANGISTWNSVEYADGIFGSCYQTNPLEKRSLPGLTCVHCHNPHQGTGPKWPKTPQEDDAKCMACHKQFETPATRLSHTHHQENSEGNHCMNCHMPKIDEGLQDIVRTHTIFSPTDPKMIEANQPNACNLCHLKENIDWTLGYLKKWYPRKAGAYSEAKIAASYPDRKRPVGVGWLKSAHESTRLVAAEALAKSNARWAVPELLGMLDDNYLMNRQFSQRRLEEMLGLDFTTFGYRFYQLKAERATPLQKLRAEVLKEK